jgi:acetylornithine deacetylase
MKTFDHTEAFSLLKDLIAIPSPSGSEENTADMLVHVLEAYGVNPQRKMHNIWARNKHYDPSKPTLLLNSHHDTVKPVPGWIRNPFSATVENEVLYGLGSNDAGASLVCLLATFLYFFKREDLPWNLIFAASAEEEISGPNGISCLLPELEPIDCAIVGEPTRMQVATAEKGLLVLDCTVRGRSGHAARSEGVNAIYEALPDLDWFRSFRFPKISPLLGPVLMQVNIIEAGSQHNVVPAECRFTVDVRSTDSYTPEELLEIIRSHVSAEVKPRSTRLRPSAIAQNHPLVQACLRCGMKPFGSPTLSDQALMAFPSVKIGPGDSARSHTADEFILQSEIEAGINGYLQLLNTFFKLD